MAKALEKMKKLYETGDWICVSNQFIKGRYQVLSKPAFDSKNKGYVLIHKSHKDVLDAYLASKYAKIEYYHEDTPISYNETDGWRDVKDFIKDYDYPTKHSYRLKEDQSITLEDIEDATVKGVGTNSIRGFTKEQIMKLVKDNKEVSFHSNAEDKWINIKLYKDGEWTGVRQVKTYFDKDEEPRHTIDLKNTWCRVDETSLKALRSRGLSMQAYPYLSWLDISTHVNFNETDVFNIYGNTFEATGEKNANGRQVEVINGEFQYVKEQDGKEKTMDSGYKVLYEERAKKYEELSVKYEKITSENLGLKDKLIELKDEIDYLNLGGVHKKKIECQFAKYGFEVEEHCTILTKVGSWLIGYYHPNSCAPIPCSWFEHDGKVSGNLLKAPDLRPLKEAWYLDKSNFPATIICESPEGMGLVWVHYYKNGYVYDVRDNKYRIAGTTNWKRIRLDELIDKRLKNK